MRYWCDEGNLGYCQAHRWYIYEGGEADCSSLVIHCLKEAGFDTGSASYTGDILKNLCARGWYIVAVDGNPQPGDILLNEAHHVAVYIGGGLLCQASRGSDPEHRVSYDEPGDQDGYETNTRSYYEYPWDCYLRYNSDDATYDVAVDEDDDEALDEDGIFGTKSCARFQRLLGTDPDGVISSQWCGDAWRHAGTPAFAHDWTGEGSPAIAAYQQLLNEEDDAGLEVDGLCGAVTINATIRRYAEESGADVEDGIFSWPSITVKAMQHRMNQGRL